MIRLIRPRTITATYSRHHPSFKCRALKSLPFALLPLQMLDHTVPGGKLNRGMAVYDVLAAIKGADKLTSEEIFKANMLGWCIELVGSSRGSSRCCIMQSAPARLWFYGYAVGKLMV